MICNKLYSIRMLCSKHPDDYDCKLTLTPLIKDSLGKEIPPFETTMHIDEARKLVAFLDTMNNLFYKNGQRHIKEALQRVLNEIG